MSLAGMIKRTEIDWEGLLNSSNNLVIAVDNNQRIVATNRVSDVLFSGRDLIASNLNEVVRIPRIKEIIASGRTWSAIPVMLGTKRYLLDYMPLIENSLIKGGVFSFREEVTADKVSSYEDLLEVLKSVNFIIDSAYDGIVIVDTDGIIAMVNQAFADFFYMDAEEMIGLQLDQVYVNSKDSRLPAVMKSRNPEIGQLHKLNGRDVVVSRMPIIKNDTVIGAIGKILFKDVQEFSNVANKIANELKAVKSLEPTRASSAKYDLNSILGNSPQILLLKETVNRVAPRGSNVLIRGESGTGKELFAHAIHSASNRKWGPFVKVNCAAIPENLLESELFGYEGGAFTGARKGGQTGKFELAHKGTIFLDEIGDMSVSMQAKLLRVLQEREVEPLGSNQAKKVDVRIVAATNVELEELVKENKFREDLYYRFNVVSLMIPPLRERPEDIDIIVENLIEKYNAEFGLFIRGISPEVRDLFLTYEWPGNVRELKNVVERAFNLATGKYILLSHLPNYLLRNIDNQPLKETGSMSRLCPSNNGISQRPLTEIMDDLEKKVIQQALIDSNGNKALTASALGISRPGLYKKLQKYHLGLYLGL